MSAYRPAPERRTNAMPPWLPVFASSEVPPQSIYISDTGWTVIREGRVEQMPAGVYVFEAKP